MDAAVDTHLCSGDEIGVRGTEHCDDGGDRVRLGEDRAAGDLVELPFSQAFQMRSRSSGAAHNEILADLYRSFTHSLAESVRGGHCMEASARGLDPFHDQLCEATRAQDSTSAMAAVMSLLDPGGP